MMKLTEKESAFLASAIAKGVKVDRIEKDDCEFRVSGELGRGYYTQALVYDMMGCMRKAIKVIKEAQR